MASLGPNYPPWSGPNYPPWSGPTYPPWSGFTDSEKKAVATILGDQLNSLETDKIETVVRFIRNYPVDECILLHINLEEKTAIHLEMRHQRWWRNQTNLCDKQLVGMAGLENQAIQVLIQLRQGRSDDLFLRHQRRYQVWEQLRQRLLMMCRDLLKKILSVSVRSDLEKIRQRILTFQPNQLSSSSEVNRLETSLRLINQEIQRLEPVDWILQEISKSSSIRDWTSPDRERLRR